MNYPLLKDGDTSVSCQSVHAIPYSKNDLNYCHLAPLAHYLHVLTWPPLGGLQEVSATCKFTSFLCSDKSLPLWSLVCESTPLACFLSMS